MDARVLNAGLSVYNVQRAYVTIHSLHCFRQAGYGVNFLSPIRSWEFIDDDDDYTGINNRL